MSEAIIFENMPYNLFLKQRMEFVVICGDHLAANVMRVVESEMIKRKEAWQAKAEKATEEKKTPPKEPKVYWTRLSLSQIIARLYMYDSAKLKKPESEDLNSPEWVEYRIKKALSISKGTLRKAIDLLKALGFLIERSKPGDEFGAPLWTLHKDNVQKALKTLPQNPFTIFHSLGGGSKFECGGEVQNLNVPPTNFECGDMQNLNVPGSENESGEVQNLEVDIDSSIDTLLEIPEIDNERESTYPRESQPATSGSAVASPTPAHSSQDDWLAREHAPQASSVSIEHGTEGNRTPLSQFFDEAIEDAQNAGTLPIATTTQGDAHGSHSDSAGHSGSADHSVRGNQHSDLAQSAHLSPGAAALGRDAQSGTAPAHLRLVGDAQQVAQDTPAGDSRGYEKAGEQHTSAAPAVQASAKAEPQPTKRTRTPRAPKVDPQEIDLYRRVFDDCYREALSDENMGYAHTKASDKCIEELLQANLSRPKFVTPKKLHAVYVRLWGMPKDERSGFRWRDHMSIKAVCKNYEEHAMALTTAAHEKQRQQQVVSEEEAKRQALALAQSGELVGGIYRRYVPPTNEPFHYITAEERAALFGGK